MIRIASASLPWPRAVSVTQALRMLMTSAEWMKGEHWEYDYLNSLMMCRCLGNCKCMNCPQSGSGGGNGQSPRNKVINPPLTFVIDTTKSVKPDKDSIFNLTQKVVESIKIDSINIPRFTLVSFNDYGPDINKNVKVEVMMMLMPRKVLIHVELLTAD